MRFIRAMPLIPMDNSPPMQGGFDLDRFNGAGASRPTGFAACDDWRRALGRFAKLWRAVQLQRGDLSWRMAVPDNACVAV